MYVYEVSASMACSLYYHDGVLQYGFEFVL
jgi:hypothetical protein